MISVEARELMLYVDNVHGLARQRDAVYANLARHVRRGDYSTAKAPAAFMYLMESAAKAYAEEFGTRATKPRANSRPALIRVSARTCRAILGPRRKQFSPSQRCMHDPAFTM
jgi:hypothetical protein